MSDLGGRPTLYNEQIVIDSWDYISRCNDELTKENKLKVNVPTVEGLAFHLEVTRSTVYLWQKEHPEFSDIIETLLQKQVQALINNGLAGNYNPTIAKVLLAKHGYSDKHEVEQTGGLTIKFVDPGDYSYPSQNQSNSGIPESI